MVVVVVVDGWMDVERMEGYARLTSRLSYQYAFIVSCFWAGRCRVVGVSGVNGGVSLVERWWVGK